MWENYISDFVCPKMAIYATDTGDSEMRRNRVFIA